MISKIDICNMALAHIGQEPIASLEQDDERARRCRLFYETTKMDLLRNHNWAFARSVSKLALLSADAEQNPGYYVYAYPQDCLFARRVFLPGQTDGLLFTEVYQQDIQARTICCKIPGALLEYTRKVDDESIFDPAFAKVFSLALASDLATSLCADSALGQRIHQKYHLALEEARRSNMTENWDRYEGKSSFVESR